MLNFITALRISRILFCFFLAKTQSSQTSPRITRIYTYLFFFSLRISVVCCPLSVVKQERFVSIREIRGNSFAFFATLREIFVSLSLEFRNELKKGGNGKQKDYYNDLEN